MFIRSSHISRGSRLGVGAGLLAGACAVLVACGGHSVTAPSVPAGPGGPLSAQSRTLGGEPDGAAGKIKHIVILVQENRSFDGLFHGFKNADYATSGKN